MLDLDFEIMSAEPERTAAAPLLRFRLQISERPVPPRPATPVHTIVLHGQVRIEPARRRYDVHDQQRLLDLFGTPERWGQTLRPLPWTQVSLVVRPFTGSTEVDLPVPCSGDFSLAATRYFQALDGGEIPLCFLFSGTVFHETEERSLEVAQISWDKDAYFRLPAATWRALMDRYYPNAGWLCLRRDLLDQLSEYRGRRGLATWEQALETLLADAREEVAP